MLQSHPFLKRFDSNPILEPEHKHWWESKAVFNPGALYESGRVHLVYRAIGDTDTSVLGYASSSDGLNFDERLEEPVYVPREPFEGAKALPRASSHVSSYISGGGGMGGCEDPRLTRIQDRVFMTYVAFDGYNYPRVALSSISLDNFLSKNWQWQKPFLISPPGVIDKNACILPEKVNNKFVILHRIFPDILIDFVDNLDFDGTRWLKGEYRIRPEASSWDNHKIGAGPPPIKTKKGWLLIYHAVDKREAGRYKIGAMLLDINDPTRVVARSTEPILEPQTPYELKEGEPGMVYPYGNKTRGVARSTKPILEPQAPYELEGWKPGVVYPCGAVTLQNRLFVYYGAADQVVCAASVDLDALLEGLISTPKYFPAEAAAAVVTPEKTGKVYGFCLKCRAKRAMKNTQTVTLKNGRPAVQGVCPKCGTRMSRLRKGRRG